MHAIQEEGRCTVWIGRLLQLLIRDEEFINGNGSI